MDSFSAYNQIMMHPDDREKTAFITERGTYCYRVMPFGLKMRGRPISGSSTECSPNSLDIQWKFDDMLVKSTRAEEHLQHLTTCFESLNSYGMKLNPTKCTFGVTSGKFLGYSDEEGY